MRLLLLILGLVAVALATALLVGPHLLDRTALKEEITERLAAATGASVEVRGQAELELLPHPRLVMSNLVLEAPGQGARLSVDRVEVSMAAAALLRGRAEIADATLVRPSLRLARAPQGIADLASLMKDGAALPFRAVSILDGAIEVAGAARRARALELTAGVDALSGGLTLSATGMIGEEPLRLDLEASALAGAAPVSLRLDAALGRADREIALAWRGTVQAGGQRPFTAAGDLQLAMAGTAASTALLAALSPFEEAGRALATAGRLVGDALALRTELAIEGPAWRLAELRVAAGGSDLSGSIGYDPDGGGLQADLTSTRLHMPAGVAALPSWQERWPRPPAGLSGRIRLAVGALEWRGEAVRQLRLEAVLPGDGGIRLEKLAASLPGGITASFEGAYGAEAGGPALEGGIDAAGEDLPALLVWAGVPAETLPAGRLRGVSLTGRLRLARGSVAVRDAELRLDASRIVGSMALVTGPRPKLAVKAAVDRLGLDDYALGPADLARLAGDGLLERIDAALDLEIERIGWHELRPEQVELRLDLEQGRLRVDRLAIGDLAGARVALVGTYRSDGTFDLAGDADIASPSRLGRALGIDLPAPAAALGGFRASAMMRGGAGGSELELKLDGQDLELGVEASTAPPTLWPPRLERVTAELAAPGLQPLLQRLGGVGFAQPALAGRLAGRLVVAPRPEDGATTIDLVLDAGATHLEAALVQGEEHNGGRIEGRLAGRQLDTDTLLDLYRLLEPVLGLPAGPLRAWPGAWPRRPLDWSWLDAATLDLAIGADLVAGSRDLGTAAAHLAMTPGHLRLHGLRVPLAGGALSGALALDRDGGGAKLGADLLLEGADARTLLRALRAGDGLDGRLEIAIEARSGGLALADLAANLEGAGRLRLTGAVLDRSPDDPALPLPIGTLSGPLEIERGIAATPAGLTGPQAGRIEARLDLLAWLLEARLERPGAAPIEVLGPPDALRRREAAEAAGPRPAAP